MKNMYHTNHSKVLFLLLSLLSVLLAACREKENKVKTICNPVNLSYRFHSTLRPGVRQQTPV